MLNALSRFRPTRPLRLACAAAALACCALPGLATTAVDWSDVSVFEQSLGRSNPLILFGFNPQPEPPAAVGTWRTTDTSATRAIEGVEGEQLFTILIGLEKGGALDLTGLPTDPVFCCTLLLPAVQAAREAGGEVTALDALLVINLATSSDGSPIDIVSFNPQPEPPAYLGDFDVWGLQFQFTSLSTATVTFSVLNGVGGSPVQLTNRTPPNPIPLPPTILLGAGALALLGGLRRRR